MDLYNIKKWIGNKLINKFDISAGSMSKMSAIDLLYLYTEIYLHFDVQISVDDINNGCFSSLEGLAGCIYQKCIVTDKKIGRR